MRHTPLFDGLESAPYRIRGALKPVHALIGLTGDLERDEPATEWIEVIRAGDMLIQRTGHELSQNIHLIKARIETIADRYIDEPVFAGQRNGRFSAVFCERPQPRSTAAAKNDCKG